MTEIKTQTENGWLTQTTLREGEERVFTDSVYMPDGADTSAWHEVSNEYKEQWEAEHPYVEPAFPEDAPLEPDTDYAIQAAKESKKAQAEDYYNSPAVCGFTFQGVTLWTDFENRSKLRSRIEAEQASGLTETSIWYEGMQFKLPIQQVKQLLTAVELYASQCHDVCALHKIEIDKLTSEEEIQAYDEKKGYPAKLSF